MNSLRPILIIYLFINTIIHAKALELPFNQGPYSVGIETVHWEDQSRLDPYLQPAQNRSLMLRIWYPCQQPAHNHTPYPPDAHAVFDQHLKEHPDTAQPQQHSLLDHLRLSAHPHAPLYTEDGPYPVIIFSHGYTMASGSISSYCAALASHGYVVIAPNHTGISGYSTLADGTILTCCAPRGLDLFMHAADDIQQLLAHIATKPQTIPALAIMDLNNIGMCGHSMGGIITTRLCALEPMIKAGVNLDGPLFGRQLFPSFQKPFMFILAETFQSTFGNDQQAFQVMNITQEDFSDAIPSLCKEIGQHALALSIAGTAHNTFSDFPAYFELLSQQTLLGHLATADWRSKLRLGTIDSQRAHDLVTSYLLAFFNSHLKNVPTSFPHQSDHHLNEVSVIHGQSAQRQSRL